MESGYLSPYLVSMGFTEHDVALLFTIYGLSAAIAAWLSGALSDLWGARRVMLTGLAIWGLLQVGFLLVALPARSLPLMLLFYGIRGFGYPLFAFGFLVWVVTTVNPGRLGSAVGWFWFCFTGGMPTLGSVFAGYTIPHIGPIATLWLALGLVMLGGAMALGASVKNMAMSMPRMQTSTRWQPCSPRFPLRGNARRWGWAVLSAPSIPRPNSVFWSACRCISCTTCISAWGSGCWYCRPSSSPT
ncbi:MFS transporter [Komagataeibacter rhaeticus]|nr:MFS transporter [Komagataeibacter rhaeticus]